MTPSPGTRATLVGGEYSHHCTIPAYLNHKNVRKNIFVDEKSCSKIFPSGFSLSKPDLEIPCINENFDSSLNTAFDDLDPRPSLLCDVISPCKKTTGDARCASQDPSIHRFRQSVLEACVLPTSNAVKIFVPQF